MMRIALTIVFVCLGLGLMAADEYVAVPDSTKDQKFTFQMTQARMKFQNENYQGALRVYRDLYKENPNNSLVRYRMGEAHYMLKDYEKAVAFLSEIKVSDQSDMELLHYYLGKSFQNLQEFKKAESEFDVYLQSAKSKDVMYLDASLYLSQVKNAIKLLANPVNVSVENMGSAINSEYVDAVPSITADQSQLIFTTRRPLKKSSQKDPNTGEFYDDVYVSYRNENGEWGKASRLMGGINTDWHDANTSISPDGQTIYLYKNIKNETLSGDIYISKFMKGGWSKPIPLPENKPEKFFSKIGYSFKMVFSGEKVINSSYFETSACVTADNNTIYFISERKKGIGGGDVWYANRVGKAWSSPKNLGANINTPEDEIGVFIHPDGNTLFYSSKGEGSMGGYDIFMVKKIDGRWQDPVNLGYPVNTPYDEFHFALSADSKTAYISSNREGGLGAVDIYQIDMQDYFKDLGVEFILPELSVVKGSVVNEDQSPVVVEIVIENIETGEVVTTLKTDEEGRYFTNLKNGVKYEFIITHSGMKESRSEVDLSLGQESKSVVVRHFILNKK